MLKIIDTHAHLLSSRYDEDREAFLANLSKGGVEAVIECATNKDNIARAAQLALTSPMVYAAVGIYPHEAGDYTDSLEKKLHELYTKNDRVVAIGEIGLDYYYDGCPRELQREVLDRQLSLAEALDAPVSLHCREATGDMLGILSKHNIKGVMHCFSGSVQTARELLNMGLYFGIGGSLTFKNNLKGPAVVEMLPMDRILLETDSPYLAPVPKRGERNSPEYIKYVAYKIAEIKKMSAEEVCIKAYDNAKRLFNIDPAMKG